MSGNTPLLLSTLRAVVVASPESSPQDHPPHYGQQEEQALTPPPSSAPLVTSRVGSGIGEWEEVSLMKGFSRHTPNRDQGQWGYIKQSDKITSPGIEPGTIRSCFLASTSMHRLEAKPRTLLLLLDLEMEVGTSPLSRLEHLKIGGGSKPQHWTASFASSIPGGGGFTTGGGQQQGNGSLRGSTGIPISPYLTSVVSCHCLSSSGPIPIFLSRPSSFPTTPSSLLTTDYTTR